MNEFMLGLYITTVGVTVVFVVLSILAVTVYLMRYIQPKQPVPEGKAPPETEKKVEGGGVGVSEEKTIGETIGVKPPIDPETISAITAAIIGFQEAKRRKLMEIELFRKYPGLARLLPLAGIYHKALVEVSIQGAPGKAVVRETGIGRYIIEFGGRRYSVEIVKKAVVKQ